jgi:tetratricopeptide (TPR) repeat protein
MESPGNEATPNPIPLATEARLFENSELGIKYEEVIEEMTPEQYELTGIKRIRRKVIIKGPDNLYRRPQENTEAFLYLTEGRFPSYQTWNHVFTGDGGGISGEEFERFQAEGEHMQEMLPVGSITHERGSHTTFWDAPLFERVNEDLEYKLPTNNSDEVKNSLLVYPMYTYISSQMWRDNPTSPFFVFGNKNAAFVEYVKQIQSNPEIRKMLELSGWFLDAPVELKEMEASGSSFPVLKGQKTNYLELKEPGSQKHPETLYTKAIPYLEKIAEVHPLPNMMGRFEDIPFDVYHSLNQAIHLAKKHGDLRKALELYEKRVEVEPGDLKQAAFLALDLGEEEKAKNLFRRHLDSFFGDSWPGSKEEKRSMLSNFEQNWRIDLLTLKERFEAHMKKNSHNNPLTVDKQNIAKLNLLIEGVPVADSHTVLPIVRHPDLRKLRWCHAEMEITEKDGKMNILFFETE